MKKLPDPKTLVDSVADGVIELAEGPVRVAENVATVQKQFATNVKANMDDFKTRMPDDPSVIVDVVVRGVAHTVKDGISLFKGVGKGIMDTADAVEGQISRVTG